MFWNRRFKTKWKVFNYYNCLNYSNKSNLKDIHFPCYKRCKKLKSKNKILKENNKLICNYSNACKCKKTTIHRFVINYSDECTFTHTSLFWTNNYFTSNVMKKNFYPQKISLSKSLTQCFVYSYITQTFQLIHFKV